MTFKSQWRKYNGFRREFSGWRAIYLSGINATDHLHAYIEQTSSGMFRASYEIDRPGVMEDCFIGEFATRKEAVSALKQVAISS